MNTQLGLNINYQNTNNSILDVLDTIIVNALLKGQDVVIPGFGYLELRSFPDRQGVLFKAANPQDLPSIIFLEGLEGEDHFAILLNSISKPLEDGKVVTLPNLGIFRPLKKEDGSFHVSFTASSFLRKRLKGETLVKEKNSIAVTNTQQELPREATILELPADKKMDVTSSDEGRNDKLLLFEAKSKSNTQAFNDEKSENNNIKSENIYNVEKHTQNKNIVIEKKSMFSSVINNNIEKEENNITLPPEGIEGKSKKISGNMLFIVFLVALTVIILVILLQKKEKKEIAEVAPLRSESLNLVDLARENYGNAAFWVYIYESNQNKLTSPINIPKGVKLTIPDLSEYNIDIKDSLEIIRANMRSENILRKYKNRL
ncbi:MAG: hypothetical protein LBE13_19005 [Bacteroidales bacterium]|jgi:nucleoid DNA-binding protein|nr:hypothetical protein [Bacteroidales bacterium]